jgi:hypothetical protein
MARDYTKYTVKGLGENFNKRQLVFEIVKDYVEKKKPSFDELTAVFKDEIQGSKGFIRKAVKVEDPKRFNIKMPLKIKFGVEVVVSNQWGSKNIDAFLSLAKKLKYKVSLEQFEGVEKNDSLPDSAETNNTNQKVAEIIYDFPTMKIPDNLFQNYKAEWGRYLVYYLENSPELEDYEKFEITLDMHDRVVVGRKEQDDDCRRWFNSWKVMIYELYSEDKSYDGAFTISAGDKYEDNWLDDDAFRWQIACHTGFEDLYDGELPDGISGEVLGEAIAKPDEIFQIYNHIQKNKSLKYSERVEKDDSSPDIAEINNSNDKNEGINHYTLIRVYKNENSGEDNPLDQSFVFKNNGEYVLCFTLSSDGDGVIDGWHFCDIKNNIFGSAGSPWGFDEFTDADEEWIEEYDSFEDFGYDENEIGKEINKMRLEFVEKYLNEKSKDNLLYEAAVPDSKISHYKVDNDRLIFEDGDKNTIPELWSDWLEW